jgi:hypothetical protein
VTPPVINLEEQPGKTVGRIRSSPENYDRLVEAAEALMPRLPFPKGVYRFRTFEEANTWTEQHILNAAVRKNRGRQNAAT